MPVWYNAPLSSACANPAHCAMNIRVLRNKLQLGSSDLKKTLLNINVSWVFSTSVGLTVFLSCLAVLSVHCLPVCVMNLLCRQSVCLSIVCPSVSWTYCADSQPVCPFVLCHEPIVLVQTVSLSVQCLSACIMNLYVQIGNIPFFTTALYEYVWKSSTYANYTCFTSLCLASLSCS